MTTLSERCRELAASAMKDGIASAALDVLREHGYEAMTIERVAERAGISKGSVYNYFRNKQELVTFVFERVIEPAVQEGERIVGEPVGAREKLEAMLRMWFDYFSRHRSLFDFLFREPAVRELCLSSRRSKNNLAIERFEGILRQGIEEGVFRPHDVLAVAEMLLGAVNFIIERQLELGESRSTDESLRRILDLFSRGIDAESRPPGGANGSLEGSRGSRFETRGLLGEAE